MNFSNNLIELRKKGNMTQEELSEKLNVSRQAVSKWESNSAFPELDKLNQISKLFNCDLDTLINGKIVEDTNLKGKTNKHFAWFGNMIGIATMIIILGTSLIVYFDAFNNSNDEIATIIFMMLLTISVGMYMYAGMRHQFYLKENDLTNLYTVEDEKSYNKTYTAKIIIGVVLILLSVTLILLVDAITHDNDMYVQLSSGIMLDIVSLSVYLFITAGINNSRFEKILPGKTDKESEILKRKITSVIMLLTTALYLFLGFAFDGFGTYWYVFIVGGIACSIVSVIIDKE